MHDFIRHLSFNSQAPFAAARSATEPLRSIMRSFTAPPAPTFRPSPALSRSSGRKTAGASRLTTAATSSGRKSKK